MAREQNFPAHLAARISTSALDKIDETAERLGVDRAQVVRWWIDEMPAGYVPARFTAKVRKTRRP